MAREGAGLGRALVLTLGAFLDPLGAAAVALKSGISSGAWGGSSIGLGRALDDDDDASVLLSGTGEFSLSTSL